MGSNKQIFFETNIIMAKIVILRAFNIKNVASPIYALLSVIRQQMSPFDPFRGGGRQKGTMSPFFRRASLTMGHSATKCPRPSVEVPPAPHMYLFLATRKCWLGKCCPTGSEVFLLDAEVCAEAESGRESGRFAGSVQYSLEHRQVCSAGFPWDW